MAPQALLNPANERLDGTQFDPSTAARTFQSTIIYPTQVVDGLVTELGGHRLYRTLQALPRGADGSRCATGHALATPSVMVCTTMLIAVSVDSPTAITVRRRMARGQQAPERWVAAGAQRVCDRR